MKAVPSSHLTQFEERSAGLGALERAWGMKNHFLWRAARRREQKKDNSGHDDDWRTEGYTAQREGRIVGAKGLCGDREGGVASTSSCHLGTWGVVDEAVAVARAFLA